VPPAQCPECGRFLSKEFVASLTDEPTPCPSCETPLMGADFGSSRKAEPPAPAGAAAESPPEPGTAAPEEPTAEAPSDPLEGWDQDRVVDLDDRRAGQADGASDLAVIGIGAAIGALLGLLLGRPGRLSAAIFGALFGAGWAAAIRRVWELED